MSEILIFNGSPRKNGDTEQLLDALLQKLEGHNVHIVNTFSDKISPCVDCRFCWKNPSCCIDDEMQEVYAKIQQADWIILASPVHYDEVSGSLLQVMSRLQVFWVAKQQRGEVLLKEKIRNGAGILAAGGKGKAESANAMMRRLLHCMGVKDETIIHCKNTDNQAVCENVEILCQIADLAEKINAK